ncbi:MAG: nucleotidyl transferase [Planctomycetes bacterium]|nr:nucleotidyl transferase [Planctomycetota bacterium]
MRAIIIGAGRGRRLMPTTENAPKCFAEVQGVSILDWILRAFREGGIDDVCFVGGYRIDAVRERYPSFTFRENSRWQENNILDSLLCAEDLMDEPFICSYCDTLFTGDAVGKLVRSESDIALNVDTDWVEHYRYRTQHPPHDAEKVTVADGVVTRVHRNIEAADAYGEFTGLARFSSKGAQLFREHYHRCRRAFAGKAFREAAVFEMAYLIHLLQEMIEAGVEMAHADTPGHYREIDTQEDLDLAQRIWGT